jgi:hypothetical protein
MAFGPEGLTLGAGTVLAATDDERNIALDEAAEARLQALLAAAYVRPVSAQTLRYIRRGAARQAGAMATKPWPPCTWR